MNATRVLAGRKESELLGFPSVRRMVTILAQRCREESWIRTSVATLERFRALTGNDDLETLRERALARPVLAEESLAAFARALHGYADSQVAALAMGAKLWFRCNGIPVPWRPLPGVPSPAPRNASAAQEVEQVILLSLIGSGLRLAELLRLRVSDLGSLDSDGHLIPDIEADPLAVQYTPRRGKQQERITFLTFQARRVLLAYLRSLHGDAIDPGAPLFALDAGIPAITAGVRRARRRNRALIQAGNNANVTLCRATGDFFREWGLPGSRFVGPEELNIEDYV
jgi:integrase